MSEEDRDSDSLREPPAALSAGARLTAQRRNLGLSIGDIARQLKLSVRQVEALEHDDYASFAGPVFVRGFIRNYARLLNLDPDALVAAAVLAPAVAPVEPATPIEERQDVGASERSRRVVMGAVIGGLVILAVVLLASNAARDHQNTTPSAEVPPPSPPAPVAQAEPPAPAVPAPPPAEAPPPAPPAAVPVAPPANAVAEAPPRPADVTPAAAPAPEGEAKPRILVSGNGPAQVHMSFEGESWVEVHDATGATVFSRLNAPGTQRVIRGTPPLSLVVGNASSVKLRYHDKPVDLHPHTNANADVARITLE